VRALARRDLTAAELDERLAQAGFAADARATALERARDAGDVDDGRVVHERARRLCERGWSNAAIRADLRQRNVKEEAMDTVLGTLDDERERVATIVARLGAGPRTARTLIRRGFPPELVELALDRAIAELP
jgi:regulatory protein